jgi:two-component system, NarL family, capsular synthesis sensor histidine kinase RcsC
MERFFSATEESPLKTLQALDDNLQRERRMFAMVIALLAFAAICAAAVTLASRAAYRLNVAEGAIRFSVAETNAFMLERQSMLVGARTLLELGEQGVRTVQPGTPISASCKPAFPNVSPDPLLQSSCDSVARLVSRPKSMLPLLFVRLDGSAAYGQQFISASSPESPGQNEGAALQFVDSVRAHMHNAGIDIGTLARQRGIFWFKTPPGLNADPFLSLGVTVALKDGQPYALVLTGVTSKDIAQFILPGYLKVDLTLPDGEHVALANALSPDAAKVVSKALVHLPENRFHWIPGYGWVVRVQVIGYALGRVIFAIPQGEFLYMMRYELALVLLVTTALIAMLVAAYRYWNYQFLTRTYAGASRALEGEILNHLLVHATPVGLCLVRRASLEIVVANKIMRKVLGLDEAATRLPASLIDEFEKRRFDSDPEDSTPNGPKISHFYYSIESKEHGKIHLEITYAPATLNRQQVYFCAVADVTQPFEAAQMLREAKLTSDAAAKAKVHFFASMSHEIRTPLSSLVGNIELLARGRLAPEQEARVQGMQLSAAGLLQIVNDVLDFSKIDVGEMHLSEDWGSIVELLERVVLDHSSIAIRQGLNFYIVIDRDIPGQLLFDSVRVSQILNNLLGNAFKFTHSGKVSIRARWINSALEIAIADSGIGIPGELKKRLFQPFTQGEDHSLTRARGTGLGLSICMRLCQLMNGNVQVESTVDVGTRILVTLPLKANEETRAGSSWTLPESRPAILCRATEYQQWLENLFDPQHSAPSLLALASPTVHAGQFDYLLVTDEFTPEQVLEVWGPTPNIVWVRQDGPIIPVERADGSINVSVYSLSGIRAATRMLDPQTRRAKIARSASKVPAPVYDFNKLVVLVAEDNQLNRELLRDQLQTLGANVVEASDGHEAMRLMHKTHVDIVFTDINMPTMSGVDLLKEIRGLSPLIPVYAVSASASSEDVSRGRAAGFTDYLTKPAPLEQIAKVLDAAVSRDAGTQECSTTVPDEPVPTTARFPEMPLAYARAFVEQTDRDLDLLDGVSRNLNLPGLSNWAHRVAGGLAVLGASMIFQQIQALRAVIETSTEWNEEIDKMTGSIVEELIEMREIQMARIEEEHGPA